MYLLFARFFTDIWLAHSSIFIGCLIWGTIGMSIISPVLLADSIFRGYRAGYYYEHGQAYHLKREGHYREAKFYGSLLLVEILVITTIILS